MTKPTSREQQENTNKKPVVDAREQELREAAERVFRRYGNNLDAFRRDVQRELVKRES